jgi:hypothetical protein
VALSEKHKAVANEYLKCFNRSEAYRAVYPSVASDTAASNAWRLWQNPDMQEYISRRLSEAAMSADEVLMRLAEDARAEYAQYIVAAPRLDMVRMAKDGLADLIPQIIDEHGNIDIVALARNGQLAQVAEYITQPGYVDIAAMERDGKKHLIKGLKPTQWGLTVEFHDAQAAKVQLGRYHKLFVDRSETRNFDIDLSKLTNDQLERVAAGEDPLQVVIDGYIATNKSGG